MCRNGNIHAPHACKPNVAKSKKNSVQLCTPDPNFQKFCIAQAFRAVLDFQVAEQIFTCLEFALHTRYSHLVYDGPH